MTRFLSSGIFESHSEESRKVKRYELGADGSYTVNNFTTAEPFSSFLPGIAGLWGVPMWAYYVNRGQAICTFGIQNKDNCFVEFESAQLHQQRVATEGFRTFIVLDGVRKKRIYEPFKTESEWQVRNRMTVRPYGLFLNEKNRDLGIATDVSYTTLTNEPFAALVRKVEIRNAGDKTLDFEVYDGLPKVVPTGTWFNVQKILPFVTLGYVQVRMLESRMPIITMKARPSDSWHCEVPEAGNFFAGIADGRLMMPVVDPEIIFGDLTDLQKPYGLLAGRRVDAKTFQGKNCQTCCAFVTRKLTVKAGETVQFFSVFGHAKTQQEMAKIRARILRTGFVDEIFEKSKDEITGLAHRFFFHTSSSALNNYVQQTYVENCLRGGLPISLNIGGQPSGYHVFGRKHGDLERDYNMFNLEPTYFSQGNGDFRDMNQNRRHDVWFNPDVGADNLKYFFNLVQLDGYNPKICQGTRCRMNDVAGFRKEAVRILPKKLAEKAVSAVGGLYTPGSLLETVRVSGISREKEQALLDAALSRSVKVEDAEYGHGYWTDHWLYNFDQLESFLAIFPERKREVLVNDRSYFYWDDSRRLFDRTERYVRFPDGKIVQVDSHEHDEEKARLISSRSDDRNRTRTGNGRGSVYRCNLLQKIICMLVNKTASFSPSGIGIDMDAGRPGWHDSINGIPGMFGSSASEIFHLRRAFALVRDLLNGMPDVRGQEMPVAVARFLKDVHGELTRFAESRKRDRNGVYWDRATSAKERYRKEIRFGISGKEVILSRWTILDFCEKAIARCEDSLKQTMNKDGVPATYCVHIPDKFEAVMRNGRPVPYKGGGHYVTVQRFRHHVFPLFLEAPAHALRTGYVSGKSALKMHKAVEAGPLFDRKLKMYIVGDSIEAEGPGVGRIWAWAPGWFESENVFLHMEHKYLLGLLHAGLYDCFYKSFRNCLLPFQPLARFARNPLENASFIVSSRHPRPQYRGRGFLPRSSGTTAEVLEMILVSAIGKRPFRFENGKLSFGLDPSLPEWLFTSKAAQVVLFRADGNNEKLDLPSNSVSVLFLSKTLVTFVNPLRKPTFGNNAARVKNIRVFKVDGSVLSVDGNRLGDAEARALRDRKIARLVVELGCGAT